jgi:hypothetical protein
MNNEQEGVRGHGLILNDPARPRGYLRICGPWQLRETGLSERLEDGGHQDD